MNIYEAVKKKLSIVCKYFRRSGNSDGKNYNKRL